MPAAPSDRRILVFTTVLVVVAGLAVAAALFFATGGGSDAPQAKPLFIGLERQLLHNIRDQGPQYIANPFAGDGFWLDVEGDKVVALALDVPGTDSCPVKWKDQRSSYIDCNGDAIDRADLDRYDVELRHRRGTSNREVWVDLRVKEPGPGSDAS